MSLKARPRIDWRDRCVGAAVVAGLGLLLWTAGLGDRASYDFPFIARPEVSLANIVILYMDDGSGREFGLGAGDFAGWRSKHAELLDRLTADKASLVVLDILFYELGEPKANRKLAEAIRANGRVVLARETEQTHLALLSKVSTNPIEPDFEKAAKACGVAMVTTNADGVARRYCANGDVAASLPWVAARSLAPEAFPDSEAARHTRWLNYYGGHGCIPSRSYYEAFRQAAGYFSNKVVFVGRLTDTTKPGNDLFRTPFTKWTGQYFPGVEVAATAFLNLQRGDWLRRLPPGLEVVLLVLFGVVFGVGLGSVKPWPAVGLAVLGMAVVFVVFTGVVVWQRHVWFPWAVVVGAQIPCALAWSLGARGTSWLRSLGRPVPPLQVPEGITKVEKEPEASEAPLVVPNYEVLQQVGKGSYGEVWLARNQIGGYGAVKAVKRKNFESAGPYEREFRGIEKFMPISRNHPGLVHLLHVGRNDAEGWFFYIMEVADDERLGQAIDPANYSPKNLGKELRRRGRLPVPECVELGLRLTEALQYLHEHRLIHRDIKPSNIIYVNGAPKIADIGLVTELGGTGRDVSYLGTHGYIAPEGPGTPAADVYSLGIVLYETGMGRPPHAFPELPTPVVQAPEEHPDLLRLNEVLLKACETDVSQRYQSAAEMHEDLLRLKLASVLPAGGSPSQCPDSTAPASSEGLGRDAQRAGSRPDGDGPKGE